MSPSVGLRRNASLITAWKPHNAQLIRKFGQEGGINRWPGVSAARTEKHDASTPKVPPVLRSNTGVTQGWSAGQAPSLYTSEREATYFWGKGHGNH